jgi:hypothetical protein
MPLIQKKNLAPPTKPLVPVGAASHSLGTSGIVSDYKRTTGVRSPAEVKEFCSIPCAQTSSEAHLPGPYQW